MAKSSMAQVVAVSRQVNELDKRGKLVILRDLQQQDLERVTEKKRVTTYKEGTE